MKIPALLAVLMTFFPHAVLSQSTDRHAGYYYPPSKQIEVYETQVKKLPDTNKIRRIGFVTAITLENYKRPYPPTTVFFAKGARAEKLIIVALQPGYLNTIYKVRAYLASLTAVARTTAALRDTQAQGILNFFDLIRMLGFEQVTISDGVAFTHQVKIN